MKNVGFTILLHLQAKWLEPQFPNEVADLIHILTELWVHFAR